MVNHQLPYLYDVLLWKVEDLFKIIPFLLRKVEGNFVNCIIYYITNIKIFLFLEIFL